MNANTIAEIDNKMRLRFILDFDAPPSGWFHNIGTTSSGSNHRSLPKKKKPLLIAGADLNLTGRRAYLAGPRDPTTSAAESLNCRVRYGNGCFPLAMAARKLLGPY